MAMKRHCGGGGGDGDGSSEIDFDLNLSLALPGGSKPGGSKPEAQQRPGLLQQGLLLRVDLPDSSEEELQQQQGWPLRADLSEPSEEEQEQQQTICSSSSSEHQRPPPPPRPRRGPRPPAGPPTPPPPGYLQPPPQPVQLPASSPRSRRRPPARPPTPPPPEYLQPPRRPVPQPVQLPAPPPIEAARPPFPWAGELPATVRTLNWLTTNGIEHVHGEVRCSNCSARKVLTYDLEMNLFEISLFLYKIRHHLDGRAQAEWMKAVLLPCDSCGASNCMEPVIPSRMEDINWLFMLLGQTLGVLTLSQLKYFCEHTNSHRTGAKNRLLFYVYLDLCRQLIPEWEINANQD